MARFHPKPLSRAAALQRIALLMGLLYTQVTCAAVTVSLPPNAPTAAANVVYSNFLGVSLELSFINYYFGNSTDTVPPAMLGYLSALQARTAGKPLRLRLGGNSMDSSTYMPTHQEIIEFKNPSANSNDQPVNYGSQLFDVMKGVSSAIGGAQYLIGLSLRTPNSTNIPLLAGDAADALGDELDAFLLGNEPDLYTGHGQRPWLANYTTDDYIADYETVFTSLQSTPKGDVLSQDKIAGPTICCSWGLASLLQSGWFDKFADRLKYITLQHYPQNNCKGKPAYHIDYYTTHTNAVRLAKWQKDGIDLLASSPNRKPLLMDEFSSAACGGIPGQSDTFAAALWTVDYALQMAEVGYAGAYLHTRERGVTYNLFDPPKGPAGSSGAWTTNPSFYGMLPVFEALQSANGSRVVDLDLENSMTDRKATVAGYAIYDDASPTVRNLVLFNFANATGATSDYTIDRALVSSSNTEITVRYLTASSVNEQTEIAWGGKTYAGVGDGIPVDATFSSSVPDKTVSCADGCTIQIPGPGLAVVFLGDVPRPVVTKPSGTSTTGGNSSSPGTSASNGGSTMASLPGVTNASVVFALAFALSTVLSIA